MISIVLVNWNGWGDTIACIQSLLNSQATEARIIVVDNNSSDESVAAFKSWSEGELELVSGDGDVGRLAFNGRDKRRNCKFVHYKEAVGAFIGLDLGSNAIALAEVEIYVVSADHNGGFSYGCNVGTRLGEKLGSTAYWLLNNDCVVNPGALALVSTHLREHPRSIVGTILRYYYRPAVIQAAGGGSFCRLTGRNKLLDRIPLSRPLDYINGASFAFSAECMAEVGVFDAKIFMYFEEIDYCMRAATFGYRCDVIQTDVFHKHGGSQGNVSSIAAWKQVLANKHYVLRKHIGWGSWMIFFYPTLLLRCVLPGGEKNARIGARQALKQLVFGQTKA